MPLISLFWVRQKPMVKTFRSAGPRVVRGPLLASCLQIAVCVALPNSACAGDFVVVDNSGGGINFYLSGSGDRATWYTTTGIPTCIVWTRGEGNRQLQGNPTFGSPLVYGISGDGSTILGFTFFNNSQPGYWRNLDFPMANLPLNTTSYRGGYAQAANVNANIIAGTVDPIGTSGGRASIWNIQTNGFVLVSLLPNTTRSYSSAMSGDGSVVVGDCASFIDNNDVHTGFVYRATSTPQTQALPPLIGDNDSRISGLSRDGIWAYGSSSRPLSGGGFRWVYLLWNTQTRTSVLIPGQLPNLTRYAEAISADGSIVALNESDGNGSPRPLLWRRGGAQDQILDLNVLSSGLGIDMDGWTMIYVGGISDDGKTFAGAASKLIGGEVVARNVVLRLDCFDGPTIVSGPTSAMTCAMEGHDFTATPAGPGPINFQWQWRLSGTTGWTPIVDGPNVFPGSGRLAFSSLGSTSQAVTVQNLAGYSQTDPNREVRVIVGNNCGHALSAAANWHVCYADFNCDASIDFFDYLDFVDALSNHSSIADFNADNVIDFFDYLDFVDAFNSRCN